MTEEQNDEWKIGYKVVLKERDYYRSCCDSGKVTIYPFNMKIVRDKNTQGVFGIFDLLPKAETFRKHMIANNFLDDQFKILKCKYKKSIDANRNNKPFWFTTPHGFEYIMKNCQIPIGTKFADEIIALEEITI